MVYWTGTSSSETYYGTSAQDNLDGAGGADTIYGLGGADTIYGGDGIDTIFGGAEGDWIHGGRGDDYLYGEAGADLFIYGSSGGVNGIVGGLNSGWDTIDGGSDHDAIWIQNASGWSWTAVMLRSIKNVEEIKNNSSGPGYIYFEKNIDFSDVTTLTNITVIRGQDNNNIFTGGSTNENVEGLGGNDQLYGNGGDDTLNGGAGADLLDGGIGFNQLTGGSGNDIFQISQDYDFSTILDFTQGVDKIQFTSAIADDISDLTFSDVAGDAHITVGNVDITVAGFDYTLFDPLNDFVFVA